MCGRCCAVLGDGPWGELCSELWSTTPLLIVAAGDGASLRARSDNLGEGECEGEGEGEAKGEGAGGSNDSNDELQGSGRGTSLTIVVC